MRSLGFPPRALLGQLALAGCERHVQSIRSSHTEHC